MKTVLLLRHGKSKRGPEYETDFDRPLAGRGKRDAVAMGEFIVDQGLVPDLVLCSPAQRARQTAVRWAEAADYDVDEIRFEESLYLAGDDAYLELLWKLDDATETVLLVGHNPDLSFVIEVLSGQHTRMPTAALARIDVPIGRWSELVEGIGRLAWVQSPRELT